jgi:uncharacterized damage-inducible protein DinB
MSLERIYTTSTSVYKRSDMDLKQQYAYVQDARRVLLEYCRTLTAKDFIHENPSFGRGGSIRNILVHIANTYEYWILETALKKHATYTPYDSISTMQDVTLLFDRVDQFIQELFELADPTENVIEYTSNGTKRVTTPFQLFTHVITHEFHHKGQLLAMSRHLGYLPVDTDVMR